MAQEKLTHSGHGMELVRKLAAEGERIFTTRRARELAPSAGLSEGYLREALHHLAKAGWLVRLRKGLYALSSTVPGVAPVHEFEIAMALVRPAAISHWSAMHYHGLTDQLPQHVYVLTTVRGAIPRDGKSTKRGCVVAGVRYRFVQVKPKRFFGAEEVWIEEARVSVTDPERTLLDGLSRPQYCGDFAEVLHAFQARGDGLDLERIVGYALRLDAAVAKRLGWVLDRMGVSSSHLETLLQVPVKGYRTLDPTGPRRGPCNRRWMIQENLPGKAMP